MLTDQQLRAVLQVPPRPYSDAYVYTGSRYYDLSHFEPLAILAASGTVAGNPFNFTTPTDFVLTSGVVDFGSGTHRPDVGSRFSVDYTYSRLSLDSASTSVWLAGLIVAQDLGAAYPYGSTTSSHQTYNDLATMGQLMVAAREACIAMAAGEVENSAKYRRGSVLMDETKKTDDWQTLAKDWDAKYKRYLTMIRPSGTPSAMQTITRNAQTLVFGNDGTLASAYARASLGAFQLDEGLF